MTDDVQRDTSDIGYEIKPFWNVLYKPPLMEKKKQIYSVEF